MITVLKPYPLMRDSGVPWLEKVPKHWEVARLKGHVDNIVDQTSGRLPDEIYVALEHVESWTGRIRDAGPEVTFDSQVRRFRAEDVLFGKLRPYLAKVTCPKRNGVCVGEFLVLRPRNGGLSTGYLEQLLRSKTIIDAINASTFGAKMPRADWQFVGGMEQSVPPLPEQTAIVRYLNYMDRRIRKYIRAKQKLIKLLEEQKQAIIHRAVTRGLDPNVRLKPSGVEWLGYVPEHWEVVALRRRWTVTDCKHLTVPFVDEGIPLASVREAQSFVLKLDSSNRTTQDWFEKLVEGGRKPRVGDLIYCRNVSVGAAALVTKEDVFAMGQDVCLIRSERENQRWLNYFLRSRAMASQLALILVGSTFTRINVADIKALLVPIPPRLEQNQIASYLDEELKKTDAVIEVCRHEQTLLREYRTRLIADVVTGKLDVREAAALLHDEAEEPELVDEGDAISAVDDEPIDDIATVPEEAEA